MSKKIRTLAAALLLLLASEVCLGQRSFQGLAPGESTRRDVARVLGPPVQNVSATRVEHKPPRGLGKVFVEYRAGSQVVEKIEIHLLKPVTRAALVQQFKLSDGAGANQTSEGGRLAEYFGDPDFIAFVYAGADEAGGVSRILHYSPALFESKVPRPPGGTRAEGGAPDAAGQRTEIGSQLGRIIEGIQSDRKGATVGAIIRDDPGGSARPGRVTGTTRPPQGVEMVSPGGEEREIFPTEAEAEMLAGRYEFFQAPDDSFRVWEVRAVRDTLELTMRLKDGPATYGLVHTGKSKVHAIGQGASQSEQFNFRIRSWPGTLLRFTVSGGRVRELFFAEEKGGKMTFAVAAPKP